MVRISFRRRRSRIAHTSSRSADQQSFDFTGSVRATTVRFRRRWLPSGGTRRSSRPWSCSSSPNAGCSSTTRWRSGCRVSSRATGTTAHTEEEIVRAGLGHPPEFQPGQGWSYSNTGYDLVGLVIKAVTGRTWYDEVDRRIVRPLGLRDTYFPGTDPRIAEPHAHGYTRFTAGEYTDTTELIDADASGGYISTLKDLDVIVRALFDGRLLGPAQRREMMRTVPTDGSADEFWPNARYGLGLFSSDLPCGGTVWIPSGDQIGYKTRTGVLPGGRRSVVVSMSSQLNDSMPAALAQEQAAKHLIDNALCPAAR
ncbi:serine hydrolase domain-containing protein [Kribbella sp. NPDC003557]|uniref:serine hydrolase domain-containing protein n=1 Tax=Kribbella sp. NPDC003557 TaxID=3154449 RepID=UPI0033B805A4